MHLVFTEFPPSCLLTHCLPPRTPYRLLIGASQIITSEAPVFFSFQLVTEIKENKLIEKNKLKKIQNIQALL